MGEGVGSSGWEGHVMNMGTYIKCHNGTSTFALSSSLSPLGGGHLAPLWRRCSFAFDTLILRLMSVAAEADELEGWGGCEERPQEQCKK